MLQIKKNFTGAGVFKLYIHDELLGDIRMVQYGGKINAYCRLFDYKTQSYKELFNGTYNKDSNDSLKVQTMLVKIIRGLYNNLNTP